MNVMIMMSAFISNWSLMAMPLDTKPAALVANGHCKERYLVIVER
jgi:hypothetical protein